MKAFCNPCQNRSFIQRTFGGFLYFNLLGLLLILFCSIRLNAVDATIILASAEGEVSNFSIKDNFKLSLDASLVGKKIDPDTVLLTGKTGTASLLFSNGVLITVKPGSRFFLKKFSQKSFKDENNLKPSELEEEPSNSELLAHLDFGNLIVKAPKLKKGSSMLVTSPLGTAGIRGTMFQLVAVRNPLTGDITGGVNLISGDISFSEVGGREISLVSGQSLQVACSRLGEPKGSLSGGLVNLTQTYADSLTGSAMPPSIEMLFPTISEGEESSGDDEFSSTADSLTQFSAMDGDWEMVHEIASEIFFSIETLETSSSSFSFDSITNATPISVPDPQPTIPDVPMSVSGSEAVQLAEAVGNLYLNPPNITIVAGANKVTKNPLTIEYLVKRKNANYPISDHGPFQILSTASSIYPSFSATTLVDIDITHNVQISNINAVDYSKLGQETKISLYVDDFEQRKIKFADGSPVSATISPTVIIIDNLKPIISFVDGNEQQNPYRVQGVPNAIFSDPGISVIDNYYSENEIISFMNLSDGLASSSFGSVNMNIAGLYEITYQGISDPSGNVVDPKTRWVEVYDDVSPDITLYGANPVYVDLNSSTQFKDSGVFATDNLDGTIEWGDSRIETFVEILNDSTNSYTLVSGENSLDNIIAQAKTQSSVNSTYRLKYVVSDLAGNKSEAYRQFVLLNSPFQTPTMVLHGDNPLIHEVNTEFSDPGVTAYKEMGTGLAPRNLNDRVNALSYLGGVLKSIDQTTVNYNHTTNKYVDEFGNEDTTKKILINYEVIDEFGNQASLDREVRVVDTTAPVISPNDDGGLDLNNLQAGVPYTDFGAVASDNYDNDPSPSVTFTFQSMSTNTELVDPSGGNVVDTLSSIGFWEPGNYQVVYSSTDKNGNTGTNSRDITVIDTVAPYVALIPHSFLSAPSTNTLNSSLPSVLSIINSNYPIPSTIESALSSLSGYDYVNNTYDQTGPGADPYINTFGSDTDFYIKDDVNSNTDVIFDDDVSTGKTTTSFIDSWGRSFIWHSAFKITFDNGVILQDPGFYVRNDSSLSLTVTSSVDKSSVDGDGNRDVYKITYKATQTGGLQSQLYEARSVYFLDTVAPSISLSPVTNGSTSFVLVEGGTTYADSGSIYLWNNNAKETSSQTLSISVIDASEGNIPNSLVRTIYPGIVDDSNVDTATPVSAPIYTTNPVDGSILNDSSINSAVAAQISSSSYSDWNNTFTIKYDASDSLGNQASPVYRYLIVKDTSAPSINNFYTTPLSDGDNSVVILNFAYSGSDYDISDEQSIKDFLVSQLLATDANGFTPVSDLIWLVDIEKTVGDGGTYDPNNPYPPIKSNNGYFITINVRDTSGNTSNITSTIQLKVGDTTPPVLTLMGQQTIHDFLRFAKNTSLPTDTEEISGIDYNTTGFGGGEHRLLYHDYNFVDPGAYAEDANSYFNISNHPDFDGDGIGESYAMVRVGSLAEAQTCSSGAGLIHIHSHFAEQNLLLDSSSFAEWQASLDGGTIEDYNGTAPSVWEQSSPNNSDHNFTDSSKTNVVSTKVKTITLKYYVKDGWDNISSPVTRTVHFYQSSQYDGVAFYATPITKITGGNFEDFYDNGSGNPFLTSIRKDTDGDGISDFWEQTLGYNPQNNSTPIPDFTDQSVFQGITISDFNNTMKIGQ